MAARWSVHRMQQAVVSFGSGRHGKVQPVTQKMILESVVPALHTLLEGDAESFHTGREMAKKDSTPQPQRKTT